MIHYVYRGKRVLILENSIKKMDGKLIKLGTRLSNNTKIKY